MSVKKFYICKKCGNLVAVVNESKVPMMCCGAKMEELVANTTDAAQEKHVPVVTVKCKTVTVNVGEVTHPMSEEHNIAWIYLETTKGGQYKVLTPDEAPEAVFKLGDEKAVAAYAYCNLHGLWKKEL